MPCVSGTAPQESLLASAEARNILLNILDRLLEHPDVKLITIRDMGSLPLGNLLVECVLQPPLRQYCLRHLHDLLTLQTDGEHSLEPLVTRFLGILGMGQEWDLESRAVLWQILETMQSVLNTLLVEETQASLQGHASPAHAKRRLIQQLFYDHGRCFHVLMDIMQHPPPMLTEV